MDEQEWIEANAPQAAEALIRPEAIEEMYRALGGCAAWAGWARLACPPSTWTPFQPNGTVSSRLDDDGQA